MGENRHKCLLGVLPSARGEPTFCERIMRWADFISGNQINKEHITIIFLSSVYKAEIYGQYFQKFDVVEFFEEELYWKLHRGDITTDVFFGALQDKIDLSNVSILFFVRNEISIENFFPQASPFYFEQGVFSRGVMPWLTQFDPCGLDERSSLSRLSGIDLDPDVEEQILNLLELIRSALRKNISLMSQDISKEFLDFANSSSNLYLAACPMLSEGINRSFLGHDISIDDFLDLCASIAPDGAELVVTQHPGSVQRVSRSLIKHVRSTPVFLMGDRDGAPSSTLFDLVCGVIVVHSMVGAQAKVAGNKLICHRDSGLAVLADSVFFIDRDGPKLVSRVPTGKPSPDVIIAYILAFLHMPRDFWYTGYGRVYLDHFLSGKSVIELGQNKECQKFLPKLYEYYERILK